MRKHNGYDLVRPMFTIGELKVFSDIFKYVPKTVVAVDLGKEKGRFNELIEDPGDFLIQELIKLGEKSDLSLPDIGLLIETEHPLIKQPDQPATTTYKAIRVMVKEQKIQRLEDIFKYIPVSTVAKDLGRKPDTLSRFVKRVEHFPVKDLRTIGTLCDLSLADMFKLAEAP
jgi:hypothetical protein